MRAHLGGLPLEAKEEEVRQWLREANPSAQFWVKPARQPGAWRVSVTCSVGQPHIPEIFRGKRIVQIAPGEDRPLRADHRLAFIRAAGVEWPQQMQEYLKNHHIVVEVSDIWRSEVAWSSGRWDGTFCVMATPEQREAIDALKRSRVGVVCLADVSLSPGWTECFASEVGPRLILRISDIWPLRCLSDRLVRWKILWDVADAARSLGERMWPLILVGLVKGNGSSNACICTNLRRNGQLWTMSEGLVVTLGPVKGSTVKPGPLNTRSGKPHRVVRGKGDNLKKEKTRRRGQPQKEKTAVGDNLKKEENPPSTTSGAALGDIGWVGMEDHAGDGNASQAGDIGGILLWLRWLGLASFCLRLAEFRQCSWDREVWKGDWLGYHGCSDNVGGTWKV
ncbi:hypothetical protein PAPYR_13377 [Paratrimastix pyriformis]|uniref:Uncharacterized protein n=1 Tax=Paratrimastix pyriformis TaxID=342808 RepID=A0ABQ8U6P6_9EUKA|nr:hypothetical protein PAPYR_13377 [Paratrimastix pyriformis]